MPDTRMLGSYSQHAPLLLEVQQQRQLVPEVDGDGVAVGDRPQLCDVLPALQGDVDPLELGEGVGDERDLVHRAEAKVGRAPGHHHDLVVLCVKEQICCRWSMKI